MMATSLEYLPLSVCDTGISPEGILNSLQPASDPCEGCNRDSSWICVECRDLPLCAICWDKHPSHRARRGRDPRPHEKVSFDVWDRMTKVFSENVYDIDAGLVPEWDTGAKWFGVTQEEPGRFSFGNTTRFATLMDNSFNAECPEQFPSIVSFIGQTGAGKSTIIRMLITLQQSLRRQRVDELLPVSGNDDLRPTTGDVQLFSDPTTHGTQIPILYADCEGLNGAGKMPRALDQDNSVSIWKDHNGLRELPWVGKHGANSKRGQVIMDLFPRLLYTFSDVVVLVLREARTLELVTSEYLIPWADSSMEGSLNQPTKPHVIIVMNAVNISLEEKSWDTDHTTKKHMDELKVGLDDDPKLKKVADELYERGGPKIDTIDGLVNHFYASATIVRLPQQPYYAKLDQQVSRLYDTIREKSRESFNTKSQAKMAANADRMELVLASAYDHFAQSIDKPFNFMSEALRQIFIGGSFAGNILQFILIYRKASGPSHPVRDSATLFKTLAPAIASCLLLELVRNETAGDPHWHLDRRYCSQLKSAFSVFCDQWLPCTYERKGRRCQNFKSTHPAKGHQRDDGKVFGTGEFKNDFPNADFFATWVKDINRKLVSLQERLASIPPGKRDSSRKTRAADLHETELSRVLSSGVTDLSRFVSHKVCLFCLQQVMPEHPFRCGHVLCGDCAQAFKVSVDDLGYSTRCPFHGPGDQNVTLRVHVKPLHAGVRILTLDGGGIRGIIPLAILREIQRELGRDLPIQSFFDLVVGTSTGGIAALALFVKNRPLEECIEDFKRLCPAAFTDRAPHWPPWLRNLSALKSGSVYKTKTMEKALQDVFGAHALYGGPGYSFRDPPAVKVAVTSAVRAEKLRPVLVANYNRGGKRESQDGKDGVTRQGYSFLREESPESGFKMWEAARVTSAAWPFLKPFVQRGTGLSFFDGGFYNNCPAKVALNERRLLWDDVRGLHPDLMLSLGTGRKPRAEAVPAEASPSPVKRSHFTNLKTLWRVTADLLEDHLDCDRVWHEVAQESTESCRENREFTSRYVRLNKDIPNGVPRLDDVTQVERLEHLVWQDTVAGAADVAHRLIASCFYCQFRPAAPENAEPSSHITSIEGKIKSRFSSDSREARGLGLFLRSRITASFKPSFRVQTGYEVGGEHATDPIVSGLFLPIAGYMIDDMCNTGRFSFPEFTVRFDSPASTVRVSIRLQNTVYKSHGDHSISISGFPRLVSTERVEQEARAQHN